MSNNFSTRTARVTIVLVMLALFSVSPASTRSVNGAPSNDTTYVQVTLDALITPPPEGATVIDFDGDSKPCGFISIMALTEQFASLGVHFAGPSASDGGGVIDECSGFGVTGHSSPNFLGFNISSGGFSGGGNPVGPETISFDFPVTHFQANVGQGSSGTITLEAYDSEAKLVDSDSIGGSSALATVVLQGTDIRSVVITFTGSLMVLDDLAFLGGSPPVPVPALSPLVLLALAGTFGLLIILMMRPSFHSLW